MKMINQVIKNNMRSILVLALALVLWQSIFLVNAIVTTDSDMTTLHTAAKINSIVLTFGSIVFGVDVNSKGEGNTTPINIAAFNSSKQVAFILLLYGSNPNYSDNYGPSACDISKNKINLEKVFEKYCVK